MELAQISIQRDSESSIFYSDDDSVNKNCSCSRTWVLVVHNDFLQVDGYERKGNDVDVENLRRVWKHERQCKFAELANCTSEQIIGTLSSGEKLSQLFHPRNSSDHDELPCRAPEVFLLFVLSHGESGGRILTDHIKTKYTEQKNYVLTLETYETCDVWNSLMDVHLLKFCVKILFFAPCRGLNPEMKNESSNIYIKAEDGPTAGFLASKPNHEDFIIFYSTVEATFSNRNELQGTWFVQSICSVLDSMSESEDILLFFTKVQNHICQRTLIDCYKENVGQTPQLHLFASKQIQFCASHANLVPLYIKSNSMKSVTKPEYRPIENSEIICLHAKDKERSTLPSELIKADRTIFYNWGRERFRYHRGIALIFHDEHHISHAITIGESFKNLNYDVQIFSTGKIMTEIGRKSLKKRFQYDGSLVICVLAQLQESNAGMALQMGKKCLLLSQILEEISFRKCKNLIGKPKLLFIIDEGIKQDNSRPTPKMEALQFSNSNAGICLFVGTRACPDESLTNQLTSMLEMEELKSGQLCLQFALAHLIRKMPASNNDAYRKCIKPQLISTLPVLVDFPPLLKPYKPFSTNLRISFAAGISISLIIFALLFLLLTRSGAGGDTAIVLPSIFSQVYIKDNCTVEFSDGNSAQVDAFSLNQSTWSALSKRCKTTWKAAHAQEFTTISLSTAGTFESAVALVKSAAPFEIRHLKVAILFVYDTPGDLQHTLKLVSAFAANISKELLVQSCIDIFHRVESFKQLNGIEMLPFWKLIQEEGLHSELNFTSQLNESQSAIIDKISNCIHQTSINEYNKLTFDFKKLYDSTKMFFIPHLISICYKKNLIVKEFYEYIASLGKVACEGLKLISLFVRFNSQLAHSEQVLDLRETSAKINEEGCKEVVKNLQKLHFSQLQTAFETYEEKCFKLEDLHDEVFNYLPDLVQEIYKGSSNNGTRLAKFIWRVNNVQRLQNITCRNTLNLTEQMRKYRKLNSFHALVLFTLMSKEKAFDAKFNKDCQDAFQNYAPSIVQKFMFDYRTNCSMDTNSSCLFNAINETNAILIEHSNSDDANVSYPDQVLFLRFVLHSLKKQAMQSDERTYKLFIVMEKKFKEMYEPLYEQVTRDYFFPQPCCQCNSLQLPKANTNFETYFYDFLFQRAFPRFGLTIANSLISRLDNIFASSRLILRDIQIICNFTAAFYNELGSNKSAIYSEEALAVFIFLDNCKILHKEQKKKFTEAYNSCSSSFGNVTELLQGKRNNFLETWNDENLQPKLLKWHKKFQISSAGLLPKLVQHVMKNSSQSLLQLIEFFSVLRNQTYSEPLGVCPGLFELVQQMRLHPKSFGSVIKEKLIQMISYTDNINYRYTLFDGSFSYKTYTSKCIQASKRFRDLHNVSQSNNHISLRRFV